MNLVIKTAALSVVNRSRFLGDLIDLKIPYMDSSDKSITVAIPESKNKEASAAIVQMKETILTMSLGGIVGQRPGVETVTFIQFAQLITLYLSYMSLSVYPQQPPAALVALCEGARSVKKTTKDLILLFVAVRSVTFVLKNMMAALSPSQIFSDLISFKQSESSTSMIAAHKDLSFGGKSGAGFDEHDRLVIISIPSKIVNQTRLSLFLSSYKGVLFSARSFNDESKKRMTRVSQKAFRTGLYTFSILVPAGINVRKIIDEAILFEAITRRTTVIDAYNTSEPSSSIRYSEWLAISKAKFAGYRRTTTREKLRGSHTILSIIKKLSR